MLVAAGCGVEDAQQEAAREEVQAHVRALGADRRTTPTTSIAPTPPAIWFGEMETNEFTCAVRRVDGGCDWFDVRVDRERRTDDGDGSRERDAGCTLGF